MNEIVIDASCIFEFLFNQADKESVVKTVGMSQLVAPNCLPFEIGNAVSKMIKRKFITVFDGVAVFHEFGVEPRRIGGCGS